MTDWLVKNKFWSPDQVQEPKTCQVLTFNQRTQIVAAKQYQSVSNSDENEISLYIFTTCDENKGSDPQGWYVLIFSQILLTSSKRNVYGEQ